ncbi:hypothetical protein Bca52824_079100 [Brassica carinata]|uniref:Uncharacterized protein n=1 Tax=Brassica carinata TaxID=52824 RepID=A0A8X7U1M0_BRACI|nr:hypothetical protein Bca52824_079100 [Brassica carinata]
MAMMYILHSDETERLARIERVKQGIAENQAESSVRLTKITNNLDKGEIATSETEAESSTAHGTTLSAPATGPTGFVIGLSPRGESPEPRAQANPRGNVLLPGRGKQRQNQLRI